MQLKLRLDLNKLIMNNMEAVPTGTRGNANHREHIRPNESLIVGSFRADES